MQNGNILIVQKNQNIRQEELSMTNKLEKKHLKVLYTYEKETDGHLFVEELCEDQEGKAVLHTTCGKEIAHGAENDKTFSFKSLNVLETWEWLKKHELHNNIVNVASIFKDEEILNVMENIAKNADLEKLIYIMTSDDEAVFRVIDKHTGYVVNVGCCNSNLNGFQCFVVEAYKNELKIRHRNNNIPFSNYTTFVEIISELDNENIAVKLDSNGEIILRDEATIVLSDEENKLFEYAIDIEFENAIDLIEYDIEIKDHDLMEVGSVEAMVNYYIDSAVDYCIDDEKEHLIKLLEFPGVSSDLIAHKLNEKLNNERGIITRLQSKLDVLIFESSFNELIQAA